MRPEVRHTCLQDGDPCPACGTTAEPVLVDRERLALAITYHAHQGGCCDGIRPGMSLSEHAIDVALSDDDPVPARFRC